MSKVFFVMDKPKCCGECEMSATSVCRKWSIKDAKSFPKDCPLIDIPQKYETVSVEFEKGYNTCIDELLKGCCEN